MRRKSIGSQADDVSLPTGPWRSNSASWRLSRLGRRQKLRGGPNEAKLLPRGRPAPAARRSRLGSLAVTMTEPAGKPTLNRVLSPAAVVLLTFSALSPVMSVYLAGDSLLHIAGTGAALAVIAGGLLIAFIALLWAELGAAFPSAGGLYPG